MRCFKVAKDRHVRRLHSTTIETWLTTGGTVDEMYPSKLAPVVGDSGMHARGFTPW